MEEGHTEVVVEGTRVVVIIIVVEGLKLLSLERRCISVIRQCTQMANDGRKKLYLRILGDNLLKQQ